MPDIGDYEMMAYQANSNRQRAEAAEGRCRIWQGKASATEKLFRAAEQDLMDALEAGKMVQDAEAEARMANQDYEAELNRWQRDAGQAWQFFNAALAETIRQTGKTNAAIKRGKVACGWLRHHFVRATKEHKRARAAEASLAAAAPDTTDGASDSATPPTTQTRP